MAEVELLHIKDMHVKLKPGESAEELVDKLEKLIRKFSEDGNWHFNFKVDE